MWYVYVYLYIIWTFPKKNGWRVVKPSNDAVVNLQDIGKWSTQMELPKMRVPNSWMVFFIKGKSHLQMDDLGLLFMVKKNRSTDILDGDWGMVEDGAKKPTWPKFETTNDIYPTCPISAGIWWFGNIWIVSLESSGQEPMPARKQHEITVAKRKAMGWQSSRLCRQASFHVCMRIAHGQHPAILLPLLSPSNSIWSCRDRGVNKCMDC